MLHQLHCPEQNDHWTFPAVTTCWKIYKPSWELCVIIN